MRGLSLFLFLLPIAVVAQPTTPIGVIQTSGATATAGTFTIEGIVTGVYPAWGPAGFFVQNDAATADADPASADALYVVQSNPAVSPGDRVRVTGTVAERATAPSNGLAVLTVPTIAVLASGQPLPAFTLLDNATFTLAAAEALEGMRVQFSGPVTVTDPGAVRSRGELVISPRGLAYQPTQVVDPNDAAPGGTTSTGSANVPAVLAYAAANFAKTLLLDDGRVSNGPQPTPYLDPVTNTVRVGSTVANLRGILGYGSGKWRIQPLPGSDAPVVLTQRPAVPTFSAAPDVRLASFNVLNYFNGNGAGGGFPTSRGAATVADFRRQRAKIIAALGQLNADVVGLMEIENDGTGATSAIQDLANSLNQALGPNTYAFVDDGTFSQTYSSDLIRCAILYKPAAVALVGAPLLSSDGVFDRPPLAQLFARRLPGSTAVADTFAFVVNHFKSKASGSGVDADQGDGQGRSNNRRRQQAAALVQFLTGPVAAAGGQRAVSVGDYNANFEEDPLDILRAAGLLIPADATALSYVFNGLAGALDHAVVTPALAGAVEVHKWNINAPEPEFLQYDVAGAATDTLSPFRSSDHDPVLIGLRFSGFPMGSSVPAPVARLLVSPNPAPGGFTVQLEGIPATKILTFDVLTATGARIFTVAGPAAGLPAELVRRTVRLAPGVYWLRVRELGFGPAQRVVKE